MNFIDSISRHRTFIWAPIILGAFITFMMIFQTPDIDKDDARSAISTISKIIGRNWPITSIDGNPWKDSKASFVIGISKEVTGESLCMGSLCQVEHKILGSDACGSFEGRFLARYGHGESQKMEGKMNGFKRTILDVDCDSKIEKGIFDKLKQTADIEFSEEKVAGETVQKLKFSYPDENNIEFVNKQNELKVLERTATDSY